MRKMTLIAAAALALLAAGCAKQQPAPGSSLYDRLGQKPGIAVVVDDFVANIAGDNRINQRFAKTDIPKLKVQFVNQICEAAGGPCKYTGKDMVTAHKGMNISVAEFNATGEAMLKSLRKHRVAQADIDSVMKVLGSMQGDIVGK
jgi:hemoglobin